MNSTKLINKNLIGAEIRRKRFNAQLRLISVALYEKPLTRMQLSIITGVRIQNVCRHIAHLRKLNQVKIVRRGICPITKESGVEFLSTNPKFW